MNRVSMLLAGSALLLAVGACGSRSEHAPRPHGPPAWSQPITPALPTAETVPVARDVCAGDAAWLAALGTPGPIRSTLMRFDAMRVRGGFGPEGPAETFNEFGQVTRSSEEKYEWKPASSNASNEQLVVLRHASGPIPGYYGAPLQLASGVLEHPQRTVWQYDEPNALFVFPDGTWVRAQGTRADQVRSAFASTGTSPPLPEVAADVAWEICGALDPNELSLPWDVWSIRGRRVGVRLFSSRQEGELTYPFTDATAAARAEAAQRAQCDRGRCPWVRGSRVEGSLVRYDVAVRTAPTSARNEVKIAHVTPPLTAPPPHNAPIAPGMPPSGVYQRFAEVIEDTCPTKSAGAAFPSMHDVILMRHEGDKAFTTLDSVEPRAPGIMTASRMPGVELRRGSVTAKSARHLCPGYSIDREMTVLEVTGNIIKVRDIVRHVGSTAGCRHQNLRATATTRR